MRILVACEESQAVTIELRKLGHEAYSCDLLPCSGGHPEWHIVGDVVPLLDGNCWFITQSGIRHHIKGTWDMIIAFPPCTYLTAVSAVRLFNRDHSVKDAERYAKGVDAARFFRTFLDAKCERVAVENPTMLKCFGLPAPNQAVEPFMFGDPWKKRTCLWLKGLPKLQPTNMVEPKGLWVGSTSGRRDSTVYSRYELKSNRNQKLRSKTFPGIAKAIAEQWAGPIEKPA